MRYMIAILCLFLAGCHRINTAGYHLSYPIEDCPRVAVRYIPEGCENTTRTLSSVSEVHEEDFNDDK